MHFIVWFSLFVVTALAVSAEKKDDPHDSIIKFIQEDTDPEESLDESKTASQPAPPVVPGMPNMSPGMPNSSPGMPNIAKMSAPASPNILNSLPTDGVWIFNFPPFAFKFIAENSNTYLQSKLGNTPPFQVYLRTSDRPDHPMQLGWLMLDFQDWHFYLNFYLTSTIQVAAYDQNNIEKTGSVTKEGEGGGVIPSHIMQAINSLYGHYLARMRDNNGVHYVHHVYFDNGKMWFNSVRVYFSFSNDPRYSTEYGFVKWDFKTPRPRYFGFIRVTSYDGVQIVLEANGIVYDEYLTKDDGASSEPGAINAGPGPQLAPQPEPEPGPQGGAGWHTALQNGPLDQPQRGPLDQSQKGPLDQQQKGPLDQPQKGPMDQPQVKPEQDTTVESRGVQAQKAIKKRSWKQAKFMAPFQDQNQQYKSTKVWKS